MVGRTSHEAECGNGNICLKQANLRLFPLSYRNGVIGMGNFLPNSRTPDLGNYYQSGQRGTELNVYDARCSFANLFWRWGSLEEELHILQILSAWMRSSGRPKTPWECAWLRILRGWLVNVEHGPLEQVMLSRAFLKEIQISKENNGERSSFRAHSNLCAIPRLGCRYTLVGWIPIRDILASRILRIFDSTRDLLIRKGIRQGDT